MEGPETVVAQLGVDGGADLAGDLAALVLGEGEVAPHDLDLREVPLEPLEERDHTPAIGALEIAEDLDHQLGLGRAPPRSVLGHRGRVHPARAPRGLHRLGGALGGHHVVEGARRGAGGQAFPGFHQQGLDQRGERLRGLGPGELAAVDEEGRGAGHAEGPPERDVRLDPLAVPTIAQRELEASDVEVEGARVPDELRVAQVPEREEPVVHGPEGVVAALGAGLLRRLVRGGGVLVVGQRVVAEDQSDLVAIARPDRFEDRHRPSAVGALEVGEGHDGDRRVRGAPNGRVPDRDPMERVGGELGSGLGERLLARRLGATRRLRRLRRLRRGARRLRRGGPFGRATASEQERQHRRRAAHGETERWSASSMASRKASKG